MSDSESVDLSLGGNLASEARTGAAAATQLAGALDKVAQSAADAAANVDKLRASESKLDKGASSSSSPSAPKDSSSGGLDATKLGEYTAAGKTLETASDAIGDAGEFLGAGGGELLAATGPLAISAGALAAGAAVVIFAAYELTKAAVTFGVEVSKAKEQQTAILDKLSGGKGSVEFEFVMKVAGESGLKPEDAMERVKGLLHAKFSDATIEILVKASADLDAVKAGTGKALLDALDKAAEAGKATERSLKAINAAGVSTNDVLKALAKGGESIQSVEAKLKAGKISAEEFAKAVGGVVEKDIGGIAGKGLDGLLNKLEIAKSRAFDGVNLGPIEGALKNLLAVFDGPDGKKLTKSLGDLGSSAIKALFGPFEGDAGKEKLTKLVQSVTKIATATKDVIELVSPSISTFIGVVVRIAGALGDLVDVADDLDGALDKMGKRLDLVTNGLSSIDAMASNASASLKSVSDAMTLPSIDLNPLGKMDPANTNAGGMDLGLSIADGLAAGIEAGQSKAIDAAVAMATSSLAAAKSALDSHSPSKAFSKLGDDSVTGFVGPMNDTTAPAAAGAKMATRALSGAGSAARSAGPASAASSGAGAATAGAGGAVFNITIAPPAGMTPGQAHELGKGIGEAAYQEWQKHDRRNAREKAEAA